MDIEAPKVLGDFDGFPIGHDLFSTHAFAHHQAGIFTSLLLLLHLRKSIKKRGSFLSLEKRREGDVSSSVICLRRKRRDEAIIMSFHERK